MAYLCVDGERRIYYEHYFGGRITVVLAHGWGMGCRVWDGTIARLQDAGVGVVAYDQRGCGRSDKDFADVSIEALGGDLVALCDHLSLGRARAEWLVSRRRGRRSMPPQGWVRGSRAWC